MQFEKYFDFVAEDAIRITKTRVGIETVIEDYQQGASPEEIILHYPSLSLEQVYATITYYLANPTKVEAYMALVYQHQDEAYVEQQRHPSTFVRSLQQRLSAQRQKRQKRFQSERQSQKRSIQPLQVNTL
jgi:uncharacterized protein (DUF433 family)